MANWSDTQVSLIGDTSNIKQASEYIKSFLIEDGTWLDVATLMPDDSVASRTKFSMAEVCSATFEESSIEITLMGRWCSPAGFFSKVAEDFKLSGSYLDREGGCDFTHYIEWEDGEEIEDSQDDYFSQLAFDHCDIDFLIEERSFITEEEEWEENYAEDLALFAANGVSLEALKEAWGVAAA